MSIEIEKMSLESEDLVAERIRQLKELFPEIQTEGAGSIDFEMLRLILGDEVDDSDERYAFTWPGKRDAIRQAQTPSTATLRPCVEKSRGRDGQDGSFDSDNLYIEGDNLEVLKLLQHSYHGKVKMIYIDPPYNTGHDFVYKDSFADSIENYKVQAGLSGQANADTSGRYHSNWCTMMYPRLKLARSLMCENGVLVSSIGIQELNNLTRMCEEIFPDRQVVVVTVQTSGGKPSAGFNLMNEYLIFVVNEDFSANAIAEFGGTKRSPFEGLPLSTFNKIQRPNQTYPIFVKKKTMEIIGVGSSLAKQIECGQYAGPKSAFKFDYSIAPDGCVALWPVTAKGKECVWRLIPERLMTDWDKGYIKVSENRYDQCPNQYSIQYLPEGIIQKVESGELKSVGVESNGKTLILDENLTAGSQIPSIWESKKYYTSKGTTQLKELFNSTIQPFDYPKPVDLIKDLIGLLTSDGDIVLDFFSGSGTSAHACMLQSAEDGNKRSWISVQLPEVTPNDSAAASFGFNTICEAGEARIKLAGNVLAQTLMSVDIGFRVFKLDNSAVIRQKDYALLGNLFDDVVKPDRGELDIVFEMMLKWGLELTLPVEKDEAAGYPYWSVAADELICCLSDGLTIEALEAIAQLEPRRVLMLDSVLTDSLKLNAVQIFKHAAEVSGSEIELRTV